MDQKESIVAELVANFHFLIADSTSGAKSIRQMLSQYALPPYQIGMCKSAEEALAYIKKHRPNVVFLDFELGEKEVFQVASFQKEMISADVPCMTFFCGAPDKAHLTKQMTSGQFIGFFQKPFTFANLKTNFENLIVTTFRPDPYTLHIRQARTLLKERKEVEAHNTLSAAIRLSTKPVEALNLLGNIYRSRNEGQTAYSLFKKSFELESKNVEALVGLFNCHADKKEYKEAWNYKVLLEKSFSIPPEIFPIIMRIANHCEQYEEPLRLLDVSDQSHTLSTEQKKELASILIDSACHLFPDGKVDQGMKALRKSELFAANETPILVNILGTLYSFGYSQEAIVFLGRMPKEVLSHPEVVAIEQEQALMRVAPEEAIERGLGLLKEGQRSIRLYITLIRLIHEHSSNAKAKESILAEAVSHYPSAEETFKIFAKIGSNRPHSTGAAQ